MEKLKIYNGFGITPSKNYTAAGYDFHVPYITDESKFDIAFNAFMKSYKKTEDELNEIIDMLGLYIQSTFDTYDFNKLNAINILHLYLALTPPDDVYDNEEPEQQSLSDSIDEFVSYRLIFDDNNVPGIVVFPGDYLLFNSGIKIGLPQDTAGIFFNKSGKGNKGFLSLIREIFQNAVDLKLVAEILHAELFDGLQAGVGAADVAVNHIQRFGHFHKMRACAAHRANRVRDAVDAGING